MKLMAGLLVLAGMGVWVNAESQSAAPTAAQAAQAATAHQHGLARLRIAIEADLLELWLQAPLASLVGFENAPRNARQRQAVKDLAVRLHQPQLLFVTPPAAECLPAAVALASDAIDPALLAIPAAAASPAAASSGSPATPGSPASPGDAEARAAADAEGRKAPAGRTSSGHAHLQAAISFRCGKPQSLNGLQVMLFEAFPALERIDVDIVTPRGESGARLAPNRSSLTW